MRADFADFEPRYVTSSGSDDCQSQQRIMMGAPSETTLCPQRPEAPFFCQVDVKVASYGPKTPADLGSPEGTPGALGRRVSSDAGTCLSSVPLAFLANCGPAACADPLTAISRSRRRDRSRRRRGPRRDPLARLVTLASSRPSPSLPRPSVRIHPLLLAQTTHSSNRLPLQKKRLPRATATQESSRLNQKIFHLPDGRAQRARDDAMRTAMAAELEGKPIPDGNPNQWADRTKSQVQFDYDAYAEVERWWTSGGGRARIEALAASGPRFSDRGGRAEMMVKARL